MHQEDAGVVTDLQHFSSFLKGNVNLFFCPEKAESPNINCNPVLAQEVLPSTNEEACCKGAIEEAAKIVKALQVAWKYSRALYWEQERLKLQPNEENRKGLISLGRCNIKKHN